MRGDLVFQLNSNYWDAAATKQRNVTTDVDEVTYSFKKYKFDPVALKAFLYGILSEVHNLGNDDDGSILYNNFPVSLADLVETGQTTRVQVPAKSLICVRSAYFLSNADASEEDDNGDVDTTAGAAQSSTSSSGSFVDTQLITCIQSK